jgi:hypothetical protein
MLVKAISNIVKNEIVFLNFVLVGFVVISFLRSVVAFFFAL